MNDVARERMRQQMRQMEAILPRVEAELRKFQNVDFVTVGAKEVGAVATPRPAFQVYVRVKKSLAELPLQERIPEQIDGFPTDVIQVEEFNPAVDSNAYRPLCGGSQITQRSNIGTLGVIAEATAGGEAPDGAPVILTNQHVAPRIGGSLSAVGQPNGPSDCLCCVCCDVGRVADSQISVDAAIATLNDGVRYSNEIVEVGAVRGSTSATTMTPGDPVFKRGRTTELTEGLFSTASHSLTRSDGSSFTNQIRVTPTAGGPPFADRGDSGSVLLDSEHRVIGLLHSVTKPPGPGTASRIEDVMATMHIRIPMMGTAGAVPLASDRVADGVHDREAWTAMGARVRSGPGRLWWPLVQRHRNEVADMVRNHRQTGLAWRRYQGPAFLSHYMKTVTDPGYRAPQEIAGLRLENVLIGMASVLQEHGSPALSREIAGHYLQILELSADCRRIDTFVDRIGDTPPVNARPVTVDPKPASPIAARS